MERSHDEPDADVQPAASPVRLAVLRERMAGRSRRAARGVLTLGLPDIDGRFPAGGLALGQPHEIAPAAEGDEVAALGFTLALLARRLARAPGEALLVMAPGHPIPYGLGLAGLGLDPGRLLLMEAGSDVDVFRALEEALRAGGLAAMAGLVADGLPLKPGRRLQLAAEAPQTAPPLLLIQRPVRAGQPNGAATRWRIASAGAVRDRFGHAPRPCWRARLDRCRNGRTGDWLLEWDHAAHRFGLPDALAGHAAAAGGGGA